MTRSRATKKVNEAQKKQIDDVKNSTLKAENNFEETKILGFHDLPLATYIMDKVENPKATIVIVHGMMEHGTRYAEFAKYLNKCGFVVVVTDLRGHGKTMRSKDEYGKGEKDIYSETIQDQLNVIAFAKEKYHLPIYLFGHSYGSMLSQQLVEVSPYVEKAVLCGTADGGYFLFAMASALATLIGPFVNKDKRGGLPEKIGKKNYEKAFERGNWLTRDEKEFDKYLADEFCDGSFPFSFYKSLIKNLRKCNKNIAMIGNKKIFLIAGSEDPVSFRAKAVTSLYKRYLKNNIDASIKIYDGARHELYTETNRKEIFKDVSDFFEKK